MAKIHFHDQCGAICGSEKIIKIRDLSNRSLSQRADDVRLVTCLKCVKKLREWGFALQSFSEIVKQSL